MFNMLINALALEDPSEYEDFYEDLSWKTFRTDDHIYERGYHKDLLVYCRKLQHCYEQLLDERAESYLYDVAQLREKFNALHYARCTLEKELAQAKGTIEVLKNQLIAARQWQNVSGHKAEVDESIGYSSEEAVKRALDHEHKHNVQRNGNKFSNEDGLSKQEKQMLAATYFENHWTIDEIAEELKISKNTVKTYISSIKSHYEIKFVNGSKYICFDSDFGNTKWMLALYEKFEVKYPESKKVVNFAD